MSKLTKQIGAFVLVIAFFAMFNCSIFFLMTRRLSNNFSGATQAQMIDVGSYLPFEDSSDLPEIEANLKLSGDLPVLDGAAALVPVYAAVIDNIYPEGCVTYEGGSFSDDNYYGENFAPDSKMQYRNTVRGYTAVVDGDCDILFCASPSQEQTDYSKKQGVELIYVPIGLEGFVFFVNKNNPVNDLTTEQVRDIYGGEITNWKDIGGTYRPINPVTRLEGSGSQSAMNAFMGERKIARKSPLTIVGGSIGFSFRYYMEGIVENSDVKILSLNGVYPSAENISNGSYPIVAKFYAVYRADNNNENIPLLIEWLLSDEGQTLIEDTGYVRINK